MFQRCGHGVDVGLDCRSCERMGVGGRGCAKGFEEALG